MLVLALIVKNTNWKGVSFQTKIYKNIITVPI